MRGARTRWIVAGVVAAVPIGLVLFGGHRGAHAARSVLLPGAGLLEARPMLALLFAVVAVAATVAWLRWGMDWSVVAVVVGAMVASAVWGSVEHAGEALAPVSAAHEFPIVVLVIGFFAWVRSALGSVPGFGWLRGRRARGDRTVELADLSPVDRCRAASILALAGGADDEVRAAVVRPDVMARARRVGVAARARFGGDPLRVDHAPARTALVLTGVGNEAVVESLRLDAGSAALGVPASEPGFVRLLDGVLASIALGSGGRPPVLDRFGLRRGHRPAWCWTPLAVPGGRAVEWEHAAATALAHERGWIDDGDWAALRQRVLGAAARGVGRRDDERLIAAGRIWLALVDDPAAAQIVARPTVRHDPLARALDTYAAQVASREPTTAPTGAA